MINLKYIENPFTNNYLESFEYFSNEKLFYDCIARQVVTSEDVFENLQFSFYTYLLTSSSNEWIGYVLLYNYDLINGYLKTVTSEFEKLLLTLKQRINNNKTNLVIDELLLKLYNYEFSDTTTLNKLNEYINNLKTISIEINQKLISIFDQYNHNIQNYLDNYKIYYNLDIVIALSLSTNKKTIETTHYEFIKEVYEKVEILIKDNFNHIPIVLKNNNTYVICTDNKIKIKRII